MYPKKEEEIIVSRSQDDGGTSDRGGLILHQILKYRNIRSFE